ncbi:dolichyl-diphosphooligosaccharide--protein glycosyltransferase subunit 1 [Dermacentor variabilis]|uniref:dolichyl-diphosphooligosaccharide--protein glycosyltransferase subunit 1 n=1 Tax=Dermacentor variabilis TaxID=34621 RepID=UPI003F5C514B
MWRLTLTALTICVLFVGVLGNDVVSSSLVNTNVDRNVDLQSQLVKISTKITAENKGSSPVKYYHIALTGEEKHHLAFVGAGIATDKDSDLTISEVSVPAQKGFHHYRIELPAPLAPGKSVKLVVETTFSHLVTPHPTHITQAERQLALYQGNHYFLSPYVTETQVTRVSLPTPKLESFSKLKPVTHSDNLVTYGPYEQVKPYTEDKLTVHYENNNPFLTVTNLERAIEVSHWGVISVEEVIDLRHTGAVLKGSFSRYEYQRDQNGVSSIKSFKTVLPASAMDVYYRDEIGNISTSHMRVLHDSVELDVRPRFPLFGGWKTHYILGYYVPTYEYLYNAGDQYVLQMRFVDHIFDDSVVDKANVKIILPEGATDIKLRVPYQVKRLNDQRHYTYLDTIGRPVIVLEKTNLVEQHIQDFQVHYKFKKLLMLQEPLLVVVVLYLLFLLVVIYVRLDFTISKDPVHESKLQVSGLLEKAAATQDRRADLYAQHDAALAKYKASKDASGFQASLKKINAEHKTLTQTLADCLTRLKQESIEAAEPVSELQRLDKLLREQFQQHVAQLEKFMGGKMSKQQYLDIEASIQKKKEDLAEKMHTITASL